MNECEHVIVVDVCCTIKRPTTMCLAKKKTKNSDVKTPRVCEDSTASGNTPGVWGQRPKRSHVTQLSHGRSLLSSLVFFFLVLTLVCARGSCVCSLPCFALFLSASFSRLIQQSTPSQSSALKSGK